MVLTLTHHGVHDVSGATLKAAVDGIAIVGEAASGA